VATEVQDSNFDTKVVLIEIRLNKDLLEGREREIKNVGTRMGTSRFTVFRRIMVYEKVQTTSRGVVGFVFFKKRHDEIKIYS